jgi:outer membrane protein TolC
MSSFARLVLPLLVPLAVASAANARCIDENQREPATLAEQQASSPADPRLALQQMVRDALDRSRAVGAAKLLAEAAVHDVDETRSVKSMHAAVSGIFGPGGSRSGGVADNSALQVTGMLSVSKLLWDGGRTDRLIDWRAQLAESARQGHLSQQEQLALNTVALALERSRLRNHVLVYSQYLRKMSCLTEALEAIARADRGRASELVQAKKSLQQAEIAMTQAQSQVRQVETRLRRLLGDGLPGVDGLASVLLDVPELALLENDVVRSAEVAQLAAQAAAMGQYAAAAELGSRPQLSWQFTGTKHGGSGSVDRGASYGLGVAVNIPLVNPGVAPAADAARKRAQAAALQREEAIDARRYRVREMHEQTHAAFDRARRVGAVLRDSEQVRNFTLQQWQQVGRRSLFDVIAAESDHYNLRVAYVNALHDGQQLNANLLSLGRGVAEWLR